MSAVPPPSTKKFAQKVIKAVDSIPETKGAGIILCTPDGQKYELRGGPRSKFVVIRPKPKALSKPAPVKTPEGEVGFWDRWGDAVMSCGSATAAGAAIYFSGGTATLFVGTLAVNSSALCGISIGKGIAYDDWQEFEKQGGSEYKTWLYIETAMALADLCGGVKGAVTFIKNWKKMGKLAQLKKAIGNKKLTRKKLVKEIQKIDPSYDPILKGAGYTKKADIVAKGADILKDAKFVTLKVEQKVKIFEAIADGLTITGSGGTFKNSFDIVLAVGEGH